MTTQVMTRKELVLLLALERMIELAEFDAWDARHLYRNALTDAQEAVRIARLDCADSD